MPASFQPSCVRASAPCFSFGVIGLNCLYLLRGWLERNKHWKCAQVSWFTRVLYSSPDRPIVLLRHNESFSFSLGWEGTNCCWASITHQGSFCPLVAREGTAASFSCGEETTNSAGTQSGQWKQRKCRPSVNVLRFYWHVMLHSTPKNNMEIMLFSAECHNPESDGLEPSSTIPKLILRSWLSKLYNCLAINTILTLNLKILTARFRFACGMKWHWSECESKFNARHVLLAGSDWVMGAEGGAFMHS